MPLQTGHIMLPRGFTPLDIPNALLWLRADRGITKDGSNFVSQWNDQTPNGFNCTQATAGNKPLWVANVQNGRPALRFNGATNNRFLAGSLTFTYTKCTLMVVTSQVNTVNDGGVFDCTTSGGLTNVAELFLHQTSHIQRALGTTAGVAYTQNATTPIINFGRSDGSGVNAGTNKIYEKTVEKNSAALSAISLAITQYRIGRLFQDVLPWNGDIFEVVLYSRALSTATEIPALSAYASSFWGL